MKNGYYDNLIQSDRGDLSDYRHASALYLRNSYRLTPKPKFLYHVVLNINYQALATLGSAIGNLLNKREFNLLVQSVDLPNYVVDVATLNQYNRKKLNQTKVNFDPIAMTMHDDMAGLTTLLWESYYRYYYQDPNYSKTQPVDLVYGNNTYKGDILNSYRYGLDKTHKEPFFNSIVVNQLYTDNGIPSFTSFTLVNPIIIGMQHDQMDQEANSLAKNTIRFQYETVLYDRNYSEQDLPAGFRDPSHYDTTPGPLTVSDNAGLKNDNLFVDFWANLAGAAIADFFSGNINETLSPPTSNNNTSGPLGPGGVPYDF